jgi:hypothetical protein
MTSEEGRALSVSPHSVTQSLSNTHPNNQPTDIDDIIQSVHNARRGHWGIRQTMKHLDSLHPGHKIPTDTVADYIARCAVCQKNRQSMIDSIQPVVRHIKPEHRRKAIGVDTLTVTPIDT